MPEVQSPEDSGAGPDRPPAAEAVVIGMLTVLLIAGLYWWVARGVPRPDKSAVRPLGSESSGGRLSAFMGNHACAECHPGESASHQRSGHAHTLRKPDEVPMTRRIEGRVVQDPESPGTTWFFGRLNGKFSAEWRAGGNVERFIVDFVFGSGEHAVTFLTLSDRDPRHPSGLEHRLTYYPHSDSFRVTPGQKADAPEGRLTPAGRVHGTAEVVHCFGCHTSTTSAEDPNVLDTATMIPNVTCERCHGMGRTHVEAARRGETDLAMGFGPGRWTAGRQMRLCGQCHRYPGVLEGVGVPQVHPSKIRPDNPEIVRFQPIGLMQSACYVKSRGSLSCVTCHDPHRRASKDRDAYEAVCISCHKVPQKSVCRVSPASGCIGCHMPARDTGQGVMFTDHWIRSREGSRARVVPGG
jgi:hypothetical protein